MSLTLSTGNSASAIPVGMGWTFITCYR